VTTVTADSSRAKAVFSLFNLGCTSCSAVIERKLKKVAGVNDVAVNYVTDMILVNYDPSQLTAEDLRSFIKKLGYDATVKK